MVTLENSQAWKQLENHKDALSEFSLGQAFQEDPNRAQLFSIEAAGLFLDYSKQLVNSETLKLLDQLAIQQELPAAINALKTGLNVNTTEQRPALHHLLRAQQIPDNNAFLKQCYEEICAVKQRMKDTSEAILNKQRLTSAGKPFTDIVHIGIGGSDLGPTMAYQALKAYHQPGIRCHFISNICAFDLQRNLENVTPEQTLFIIASKTFSTLETLKNADSCKQWLSQFVKKEDLGKHFYAVTSHPDRARQYGIEEQAIFPFWDWVGGRYSTYSAIGLSLAIGIGYDNFNALLEGAEEMDQHFFNAPLTQNMPVIMALMGIWSVNFWHKHNHCIAPYDHRLRRFPAYLQQLEMESTGKSANRNNETINYATCPSIFGESGTNSQHSYFQHLHQSPEFTPVDFIVSAQGLKGYEDHHNHLFASCLAQSRALMTGKQETEEGFQHHKSMPGNRPSSTLMMHQVTPQTLGALIALYEHKVYSQSIIWNVNAFDQWGVELGKKISCDIKTAMETPSQHQNFDESTQQLMLRYQQENEILTKAHSVKKQQHHD